MKLKRDLLVVPGNEGSCPHTLLFSSPQEELFLAGEFPLGAEQCQLEDRRIQTKMKLSSFHLCAVILKGFLLFHYVVEVSK